MGRDKASLPFGDETLLSRVMRLVVEVVPREQIILVAAADQQLSALPWEARVVRDRAADRGPLPALIDGLAALHAQVTAAFVTACDFPLLEPALIEMLFQSLTADIDVVVPADGERLHPLLAVYRPHVMELLQSQLAAGTSSLHGAIGSSELTLLRLPIKELRSVDAELRSFRNCNTDEEYQAALKA